MKLSKSILILASMITLSSSMFAKELTRNDYIRIYQKAEMPNESLDNLEKFKVKGGDSLETCLEKLFSTYKLIVSLNKNKKDMEISLKLHRFFQKNESKAIKLYPNNIFLKFIKIQGVRIQSFKNLIVIVQESANTPYINMKIYGNIFILDKIIQNEKLLEQFPKRYKKLFPILFEYKNEAELKEQLNLLKKYWRNLLDDDFIIKINAGQMFLKEKRVELTDEELTKARKIWAKLVENVMKYNPEKENKEIKKVVKK